MWFLLACASAPPPAPPPPSRPVVAPIATASFSEEIVAVGDLHGDPIAARQIFQKAGLVDENGHWSGGKKWLVQTGDVTDRGPDSKGVLALLRQLQSEASAAGGRVVPLLGNHETMNVMGDWRYVSPEDLSSYGGEAPRKAAFSAEGEDGKWLRTLDAVAKVGDTVFMHGGMSAHWAKIGIPAINLQVRAAMSAPDGKSAPVLAPDGPLWNRAYVLSEETAACPELQESLDAVGAKRMVVGHTVREDGKVQSRCDGRLWVIDTGNSIAYGRHLSALQINGDQINTLYPGNP